MNQQHMPPLFQLSESHRPTCAICVSAVSNELPSPAERAFHAQTFDPQRACHVDLWEVGGLRTLTIPGRSGCSEFA